MAVTHATFYSKDYLFLNISVKLRRGPSNVPMLLFNIPEEIKERYNSGKHDRAAKNKTKSCICFETVHALQLLGQDRKQKPKKPGTVSRGDPLQPGSWGFLHTILLTWCLDLQEKLSKP